MTSVLLLAAWIALAPTDAVRREAVVLTAVENMYSGPYTAKDVVSQSLLGQVVGIVEERDGYARIETPDHYRGWVPVAAVFPYADPAAARYARRGIVADVTALMANLYRDPNAPPRDRSHRPPSGRASK